MTIRIITCARRHNGRIIGIGTQMSITRDYSLSEYFTAREVSKSMTQKDYVIFDGKKLSDGKKEFYVSHNFALIKITVKKAVDKYYIQNPVIGDVQLFDNVPKCSDKMPKKSLIDMNYLIKSQHLTITNTNLLPS